MTATDPSAPHDAPAAPPRPARSARVLRFLVWAVADLLVLVLVLAGAAWWWAGSDQSLATALAQAQRFLPADQTLATRDVSGSLRAGGHIGWLRWSSPTLAVEVDRVDIGWRLRPLLQRDLQLGEVHARAITIEHTGPPSNSPTEPLQGITLPIRVDLPFRVDELRWVGPPPLQATALAGRYRYDGEQHHLTVDGVDIADGHYSATLQLQGAAPMAINATLDGSITTPVPGSSVAPLAVAASASVQGTLAGTAAALQVQAQLQPSDTSPPTGKAATPPMQAQVQADIAPWAPQPLVQAQADFSALDLARLWPQAPSTLLSGKVSAGPQPGTTAAPTPTSPDTPAVAATRWQIQADVRNARPGPWDTGRLPVDQLTANALFDGSTWDIPSASLRTGPGEVALQGRWSPTPTPSTLASTATPAPWQLRTTVRNLSPALLHTQLAPAALNGTATAAQTGDTIQFDVALNAAAKTTTPAKTPSSTPRLDSLVAKGQWRADLLTLDTLRVIADQVQLQGQLKINTAQPAAQGQLALTVPGAQAQINGQMAPTQGAGTVDITLADATKTQRWVESLPGLSVNLGGNQLQGQASLKGSWQGGWQSVQTRLATGKPPASNAGNPGNFTVQATLAVPQLDIKPPPPAQAGAPAAVPLQLRGVRAELAGHLAQASLAVQGELRSGSQKLSLQTQLNGGMEALNQWRAALTQLTVQVNDTERAGPWKLQLNSPTSLSLRTPAADTPGLSLLTTAGSASLTGPLPGTAQISWEPVRYSQTVSGASPNTATRHQLQTKGQLQGLPIAWAQALAASSDSLRNMGLGGNLVFGGNWDIDYGDTLRAHAQLSRTSGDIQVQTGDIPNPTVVTSSGASMGPASTNASGRPVVVVPTGPTTSAGVRQAQITLDVNGTAARAQVLWDSAHAGQLQADASTQLSGAPGQLQWAANAPLAGKVRASMPSIGAWSVLAPPGWRVQGTLDADAQLSGTRDAPRWSGNLAADGLSIRSVVDGVDLREGRMRASLNGERIDITEFTLRGGTGSSIRISGFSGNRTTDAPDGGLLTGRGNLTWGGAAPASGSGIRMQFDAEAKALRVLVRSDRQLTLSGTMQAALNDGQFTLRAKLRTDRAAIILPDETAPQLGKDVVVRSVTHAKAAPAPAASVGPVATPQTAKPPDIAITFNLGDDFAVQGHGVTTRLTGELDIRSTNGLTNSPRVNGEIRTDRGKYRAYGQQLDVETGIIRFNGTLDNPALDILALRPNISVRAGAQITGTAQSPRVRLYSDPVLPDAETLSWIVLGHGIANGGAEAALLQQAALTLLGRRGIAQGSIANRLGLDEVGFRAPVDGETTSDAVLTFGKRISQNMYVVYESSLSSALGTLFIFYDLTRRLTLRAQTGSRSAVDLIYTVSFD